MPIEAVSLIGNSDTEMSTSSSSGSSDSSTEANCDSDTPSESKCRKIGKKSIKALDYNTASKIRKSNAAEGIFFSTYTEQIGDSSPIHGTNFVDQDTLELQTDDANGNKQSYRDEAVESYEKESLTPTETIRRSPNSTISKQNIAEILKDTSVVDVPSYATISPVKRHLILAITIEMDLVTEQDHTDLMEMFFQLFCKSNLTSFLSFNDHQALTIFQNIFWLACENMETYEWILEKLKDNNKYKITNFIKKLQLESFTVVIPEVGHSKDYNEIFSVLEKQNIGLKTVKWVVHDQKTIDKDVPEIASKIVSILCRNILLTLLIDGDSRTYLETVNFKLKYCFWKIVFQLSKEN